MTNTADYLPGGKFYAEKKDAPQDGTLNKVRALLASADDESYPEDVRDRYRAQAEALMFKYKIDALDLNNQPKAATFEPKWLDIEMDVTEEFIMEYRALYSMMANHTGCKAIFHRTWSHDRQRILWRMETVGFVPDLQYMELLLTSAVLAFGGKLRPRFNPDVTIEENIYAMRSGGMERGRIARQVWPDKYVGRPADYVDKNLNRKVTNIYEQECAKRGERTDGTLGRGVNMRTYRKSYAEGFVNELWSRLYRMKLQRGAENYAIQLANVQGRVDEAFYARYPYMRPSNEPNPNWVDPQENCQKCKVAKSEYCREHAHLRPTKVKEKPFSQAGMQRGYDAARSVDLGGSATTGALGNSRREVEGA